MTGKLSFKSFAGIIRLPFLLLAPVCVFLAAALAHAMAGGFEWWMLSLVLVCALSAHVAVNALNEYQDFLSGLDLATGRTPFSGGSGTLPAYPHLAPVALKISLIAMAMTVVSGLVIVYFRGMALVLPGLLGIALIVLYTRVINRYPMLCLLSPGLGFGILMVGGSYFALTGGYNWEVFLVSLIPFFLANNLLLLNQFPDVAADSEAGRRHLPVQYGLQVSSYFYLLFLLLAALSLIVSVYSGALPQYSLLGLLLIAAGLPVFHVASQHTANTELLLPYMGVNVGMVLFMPLLLGVSLFQI